MNAIYQEVIIKRKNGIFEGFHEYSIEIKISFIKKIIKKVVMVADFAAVDGFL